MSQYVMHLHDVIFLSQVNTLGPIVTMPFMLTYAAVDYAYFSLAMSFDKRKAREDKYRWVATGYQWFKKIVMRECKVLKQSED